jgi:hypothetical protein
MAYQFHFENFTRWEETSFYGSRVEHHPIYPSWPTGFLIADIKAAVEKFKPMPRRKIYCASLNVFPLPQLQSHFRESLGCFEVYVREWIADLDLEPGIYGLDNDFLIVGAKAPRVAVKRRPPRGGLTRVVWSKPNRAARREKGRKAVAPRAMELDDDDL